MLFSPQIPLQLEPRREQIFANFVAGANGTVVSAVRELCGSGEQYLHVSGGQSTGKSHLLNAACIASRSLGHTAFYAGLRGLSGPYQGLFQGLEQVDLLCLDDVDALAGRQDWEEALFHCINRIRESGSRLLVASRFSTDAVDWSLPDLHSRLQWGTRLKLQALNDEDKLTVLKQQARMLGIELADDVGQYLISRSSRHLGRLVMVVEQVQQVAFSSKRRVTIPLVREVLGRA